MEKLSKYAAALVLAMLMGSPAHAEFDDARMCRNGLFPEEGASYALARVTSEGRLFLIEDNIDCEKGKTCPVCPRDAAACQSKSFLLPGDLVVAGKTVDGNRCVFYRDQKNVSGSAGYVPQGRLEALPPASVTQKDWLGEWRIGDIFMKLRAKGAALSAKGEAVWGTAANAHVGEMSGVATPKGNEVTFVDDEDECHVSLTLLPPFVLARDNNRCGGLNVTFTGVYLRAPTKAGKRP
jgi:hypothetical protein